MQPDWKALNDELINELERCQVLLQQEVDNAECSLRLAVRFWHHVKEKFLGRNINSDQEEIEFFKQVKPHFTTYIEYYLIINQGLLFVPDKLAERTIYWVEQEKRYQRFKKTAPTLYYHYVSGCVDLDASYFLQRHNHRIVSPQEKIYEDEDCRSSHDYLVRGLFANRMYTTYVGGKLNELKKLK